MMLCTLCKKHLPIDHDYVWRTLGTVKSGPLQWAKMPAHHECKSLVEQEVMKSKIGKAAGIDCFLFALEEPKNVDERPIDLYSKVRINRG